jgi:hypothetical protein
MRKAFSLIVQHETLSEGSSQKPWAYVVYFLSFQTNNCSAYTDLKLWI